MTRSIGLRRKDGQMLVLFDAPLPLDLVAGALAVEGSSAYLHITRDLPRTGA